MSTAAKTFTRPPGRPEGKTEDGAEEKETTAAPKKTRVIKTSYVFEGPSTAKRYGGNLGKLKKELTCNAKLKGRAVDALRSGWAPTWMAPAGDCRPKPRNEFSCKAEVLLTTGATHLRDFLADDGKPFALLSAPAKDIVALALRKSDCATGEFLSGSLQGVYMLSYAVSAPPTVMPGVAVAPVVVKQNGDVVTKLKRPIGVFIDDGQAMSRTAGSATHFGVRRCPTAHSITMTCECCCEAKSGARAEVKHDLPISTEELGTSIGQGSLQGEFISGTASGFMEGTELYKRESSADSGGCCTFNKERLEALLERLQSDTDAKVRISLKEDVAGVAPSLLALLFCEFAHVIFNAPPGTRQLTRAIEQHLEYSSKDKKCIVAVSVKRKTMIKVVQRALAKHIDDEDVFTASDRIGFSVTPVTKNMDKKDLLRWSSSQQSNLQKEAVFNPAVSISIVAELCLVVRTHSSDKDSDEEITDPDSEEEETTGGAAAGDEDEEGVEEEEEEVNFDV